MHWNTFTVSEIEIVHFYFRLVTLPPVIGCVIIIYTVIKTTVKILQIFLIPLKQNIKIGIIVITPFFYLIQGGFSINAYQWLLPPFPINKCIEPTTFWYLVLRFYLTPNNTENPI